MKKNLFTFIVLSLFAAVIWVSPNVSAATKNIAAPFDIGTNWYICQGYNSNGTHSGNSRLGLDLTGGPNCDSSASGRTVRAPFAGTVSWITDASGSVCISSRDGRSVMLTHINPSTVRGATVSTGQAVGSIAASGQKQNNGVAHLHFQAWSGSGCGGSANAVPFDLNHSMRICGAPDLIENGPNPYGYGAWSGTKFTARGCTDIQQKPAGYIYRFWSDQKQRHFYTSNYTEAQRVVDAWPDVWKYEPNATFQTASLASSGACDAGLVPTHRFWSDSKQGHFYTADEAEKNQVIATWPGIWKYERIAFCVASTPSAEYPDPLYRFWSDSKQGHFYTADEAEKNQVIATWPGIWKYERIAFYIRK